MQDRKNNTSTPSLEATHNLIYEAKNLQRQLSEIIKGANEYPEEFSRQARARIEAEKLKARNQLEQQRNQVPWSGGYLPRPADEENLRKYILRVFLVFAQEACKLGSRAQWTVDRIRSEADEFLRRFTIKAHSDEGYDKQGRKLEEMTDYYGTIKEGVWWAFKESAEYHQFEQELLAVAEQQARGSPQSSGGDVRTLSSTASAGESIVESGEEELKVAQAASTQEQAEIIEAPVATRQPTLGSKKKPDPIKIAQIEKAIASRIRKNAMLPVYREMWIWLDGGNRPAEFIAERADFLKQWTITKPNAFKMFHRVNGWRKKGINPTISSSPKEP